MRAKPIVKPVYSSTEINYRKSRKRLQGFPPPYLRIKSIGDAGWRRANQKIAGIRTPRFLAIYQAELEKKFSEMFGPLPDLSEKVDWKEGAEYACGDISVRQVILKSSHGYEISAFTYRKKRLKGRIPGLVFASGHYEMASCHKPYMQFCLFGAMSGFHVLAFDPPGLGSRREVFLKDDHPVNWRPTAQHQHLGAVTSLLGKNLSHYFVHDCVTAVSFLSQRTEVDPSRIGFAGHSGGGLQTFLAMAADPRIKAAVPLQSGSTRRGAFATNQMHDVEQCFYHAWEKGFDLHEMALLFAPRPLKIVSELGHTDQFDIYRKLKPVYKKIGFPENLGISASTTHHDLERTDCEVAMQWFCRHLAPPCPMPVQPEWKGFERFWKVIRKAQSRIGLKERGILASCRKEAVAARAARSGAAAAIKKIPFLKGSFVGRKHVLKNRRGLSKRAVVSIILDENGRKSSYSMDCQKAASSFSESVVALDVFNCGELRAVSHASGMMDPNQKDGGCLSQSVQQAMQANMAGKCPVGLAIEEVLAVIQTLGFDEAKIFLFGRGWPAISLLLLSAVLPNVCGCCLSGIPESYEMLMKAGRFYLDYSYIIPGILKYSDIPLILKENRKTTYVLSDLRYFEKPEVDYRDRSVYPNVHHLQGGNRAVVRQAVAYFKKMEAWI